MIENFDADLRKEGFSKREIMERISKFRIGDKVRIPKGLIPENESKTDEIRGTVKQICKYHIVFQLDNGIQRSLSNFECMDVYLDSESDFRSYGEDRAMKDVFKAMERRNTHEKGTDS